MHVKRRVIKTCNTTTSRKYFENLLGINKNFKLSDTNDNNDERKKNQKSIIAHTDRSSM